MPHPKMKSENYHNFGGINSKYSPYVLGPMEFLDLINLDFQTPGSLTHRWGSTQYVGQTFPGPINSLFEFSRLDGSSQVVISYSGGIFAGATTGQSQGLSFTVQSQTQGFYGQIPAFRGVSSGIDRVRTEFYAFSSSLVAGGANFLGDENAPVYGIGDTTLSGGGPFAIGTTIVINASAVQSDNTLSYAVLNNYMFAADGNKFFKYDGITTYPIGLPPPLFATAAQGDIPGITVTASNSYSGVCFPMGSSYGTFYLYASYVNNRGFEGPVWPLMTFTADTQWTSSSTFISASATLAANFTLTIATPLQFGISSINIYSFYDAYNSSIGQTFASQMGSGVNTPFYSALQQRFWTALSPVLLSSNPASGSTTTTFGLGTTQGGFSLLLSNLIGRFESTITNSYLPLGLTAIASTLMPQTISSLVFTPFFPRYLENYQNRLFLAGFSAAPSTVVFSDVGEPEGYTSSGNFDVRTNDGDSITAIKTYGTKFYVFKNNSFHILTGDNPNNFFLQQVSDQYGCINNRCAITYDDVIVFVDRKAIMIWNGGTLDQLSAKIQPIFDSLNYAAAKTTACAVHDKLRNQVLFGLPINGSNTNNITLIYDYLINAWSKQDGFSPSAFAAIQGRNVNRNAFYGDNSGRVNWFGPSFLADNGVGFTAYLKTRFLHDIGDSTQKMFRRLYVNADAPNGNTLILPVNFFQDYGSSVVLGSTVVLGSFQNRIDFGVSAKSLAFEMSNLQTAVPLKIHGFTIESRFLRGV